MGRRVVLIVAGILLLAMGVVPPWRVQSLFPHEDWVEFAPVFASPDGRLPQVGVFIGGFPPPAQARLAWDLLAGEVAALAVVVLFALRCLPRKGA